LEELLDERGREIMRQLLRRSVTFTPGTGVAWGDGWSHGSFGIANLSFSMPLGARSLDVRRPDLLARDGTVAIGGPNRDPGEPAAQLAGLIASARALSARYEADRIRYKVRAEVMPVTRNMLAAAVDGNLASLAALVWSVRDETYQRALTLCVATAGYVPVDVSRRPPAGRDAQEIARLDAERENAIRQSEVIARAYVKEAALGIRPAEATLVDAARAARLTIMMTGRMVFRFRPAGSAWWQYLDHVWETSVAEQVLDLWCPPPTDATGTQVEVS
jgi:hypothetical protein